MSVCLSAAACLHYCTDPDVTWGSGRACSEVVLVHYWVDLQPVHGLRCYGNITRTRNVSEYMLALALYLVVISVNKARIQFASFADISINVNLLQSRQQFRQPLPILQFADVTGPLRIAAALFSRSCNC